MMRVNFKQKQAEFVAYIRRPESNPMPEEIESRRMQMYRELLFNNVDNFLSSNFPVLNQILNPSQWYQLSQGFFESHSCSTPYFSEIPEEFLHYLQHLDSNQWAYPFILELAHYEWVEMSLAISTSELIIHEPIDITDPNDQSILALSDLAWPLVYEFPVHRISAEFLPLQAPELPTYLLVHRDQDDKVHFMQINALVFRLIQIIQDAEELSLADLVAQIVEESRGINADMIIEGAQSTVADLLQKNILFRAPA